MRTRTHLTTPPGVEPVLSGTAGESGEVWLHALELPTEPRVPSRWRRLWTTLALVVVLGTVGYLALQVMTAGEDQDPALDPAFRPTEPSTDDEGLPGDG